MPARMAGAYMLIKIAALLAPVGAVRALELRLFAALVSRVPEQGAAMLVALAAFLATIREFYAFGHPERRQILHERLVDAVLGYNHGWCRRVCKRHQEKNGGR